MRDKITMKIKPQASNCLQQIITATILFCSALIHTEHALAQSGARAAGSNRASNSTAGIPIQLIHAAVTEKSLPNPGSPLTLAVEVVGSTNTKLPIRLIAVRDGKMIPVPLSRSTRTASDRPLYEFVVPSPTAELSYQFMLPVQANISQGSGMAVVSSERYSVRRGCVPIAALDKREFASDIEQLSVTAKVLEADIEAYSAAVTLAERLKKEVSE